MRKKLTKHGNSLALVIDKPILELLKISPDTFLELVTDGSSLIVTPVKHDNRQSGLSSFLESANRRYGTALDAFGD